jgi:hypothetical protein
MALTSLPKHATTRVILEGMNITNLVQPVALNLNLYDVLASFHNIQLLDLSSNNISLLLPEDIAQALFTTTDSELMKDMQLSSVISVNLSDNPITNVTDAILQLNMLMPNVQDIQISLYSEKDADFIIKTLPNLEYLNNLPVEK